MQIANRLLSIRIQHNMKRADLAAFLGVDYATVYRWEKQHSSMTLDTLLKIARLFEVAPTDIIPNLAEIQLDREEMVNA